MDKATRIAWLENEIAELEEINEGLSLADDDLEYNNSDIARHLEELNRLG